MANVRRRLDLLVCGASVDRGPADGDQFQEDEVEYTPIVEILEMCRARWWRTPGWRVEPDVSGSPSSIPAFLGLNPDAYHMLDTGHLYANTDVGLILGTSARHFVVSGGRRISEWLCVVE